MTLCAECKTNPAEIIDSNGRRKESLWCAPCKAKLIEATRGMRFARSDAPPRVVVHRDFPGEHGGADCWCRPVAVEADSPRETADVVREANESDG